MYDAEQLREAAGKIDNRAYTSQIGLQEGFSLSYSRTPLTEPYLLFRNYLLLLHEDKPAGFLHFLGPRRERARNIDIYETNSHNSLDITVNQMLGAPNSQSIYLLPEYRHQGGQYKGVCNAMITAGMTIADELGLQSGARKYHQFMFEIISRELWKSLTHYPGFEFKGQDAIFSLPGNMLPIEIAGVS